MDSGVSSEYSASSTGYCTPTDNSFSRRSSVYSVGFETSTMNGTMQSAPYFRQVSFDNAWENSENKSYGQKQISMEHTSTDFETCSTMDKRSQFKGKFTNKKNTGRTQHGSKEKKSRLKMIPGRRKSVATRSKAM
jgi:hypothetical protein